ncbi:hypothetical protein QPL79_03385 [Ignisphaera sp. 4213-co]|uniref:Uncharacterized protein n=1 Tax=Ignisphaera cupida TaxID=3050454 RepID=A0ABD4Z7X5_9CREN|nr:hypothetical protein [Ignisphaera sp. 4213-co]MDK6028405.1 hypothetical protein [Ignisphaera sp. 4213-co]
MVKWSNIVEELYKKSEDIYMQCPTCSTPSYCTDYLEPEKPFNIISLNNCCACLLQLILDNTPNVVMFHFIGSGDDNESFYILDDVFLDVTEDNVVVVPLDKINEYIESIEELDSEKANIIRNLIANKLA